MSNRKKPYEKPILKGANMLETSAATCCKTNNATCKNRDRDTQGKGSRTSSAS
jgi:hypothetical protein